MQITLHSREGAVMAPGLPVRISCLAGVLWITSERDSNDRVLAAGQSADLPATHRQYLSSVGRHEMVSFDVSGAVANISVNRSGAGAGAVSPAGALRKGWRAPLPGTLPGALRRWLERGRTWWSQARLAKA